MDREEFLQRYKDGQRDFSNLDLRKIDLSGNYSEKNDLSGCNFTNSDLRQADLSLCNLSNVDFTNARLEWTYFHGAKIDSKTILSSKYLLAWQLVEDGLFDGEGWIYYQFRPDKNKSKRDFRFQDLSYTNLNIADLKNLDFTGTNFSQSSLQQTDLSNVNLSGANLEKASLHLATLKDSIIDEKTKLDDKWRLVWELVNEGGKNRNLEGVDLSYANLSDADLTEINLKNANLTQANLSRCNLTDANLKGADLTETKFHHTILINTILIDVKTDNTKFYHCTAVDTIVNNIYPLDQEIKILNQKNNDQYIHLNNIDLKGCNLSNLNLKEYNFSQCVLRNINFKNSNLSKSNFSQSILGQYWTSSRDSNSGEQYEHPAADFSNAILTEANFFEADLNDVNFSGANLQNANLTKADLSNADLTGADLRGANLENAKLDYVNLRATIIDDSTKISEKCRFIWEFINSEYPKKINLKGLDFSYIKLEYFDFSGCDLSNINLSHAILKNCDLSDTFFSKANLSNINLEESNLTNSVFVDSVIASADLNKSNCQNIKFKNCNLFQVSLCKANLIEANFNNCILDNSYLSESKFKNAILQKCKLINVKMSSSNLTNANFIGSNLQGANLQNTILKNTDFTGANLENVIFFQEGIWQDWFGYKDKYDMEKEIEKAIIHNTNLKGTIFENKFIEEKQEKSQDYSLLVSLQKDFIHRIETGHLLNCDLIGYHSELTIIEGDKLERLRDYCWEMVKKFRNHRLEPRKIFINNLTGKLGEEVVKNRLGDLVNTVDYKIYDRGDGGIDLTLRNNNNLGIQVKTRTGDNINDIQWKITRKEIETNIALVCIYSQEKVTEAQLQYHLILAGFMPTNEIKSKENEVFLGIKELFYGGGLKGYLESYINEN